MNITKKVEVQIRVKFIKYSRFTEGNHSVELEIEYTPNEFRLELFSVPDLEGILAPCQVFNIAADQIQTMPEAQANE